MIPTNNKVPIAVQAAINRIDKTLIQPETSCVQLAVIFGHVQIIDLLLQYLQDDPSRSGLFFQNTNKLRMNNLDYMLISNDVRVLELLVKYPVVLQKEAKQSFAEHQIMGAVCQRKRYHTLHFLCQLAHNGHLRLCRQAQLGAQSREIVDLIYRAVLRKYGQLDVVQLIEERRFTHENRLEYDFGEEEIENSLVVMRRFRKRAYYYARERMVEGEWADV